MKIEIYSKFTGIDKNGRIIAERNYEKCNSIVKAFPAILLACFQSASVASVPDIGGTNRTIAGGNAGYAFRSDAGAGGDTTKRGPQVGTGTNAVAIGDVALQTRIVSGTGSGQLQYSSVSFGAWTVAGSDAYCQVFRTFTNGSGANITINEIGFYVMGTSDNTQNFCIERTLPTPYTVYNGTGVILEYKWVYTV